MKKYFFNRVYHAYSGIFLAALMLTLMLFPLASHSTVKDYYSFEQPAQAMRYYELLSDFRCLVCQNQDLHDSNAKLAEDLRREIYRRVRNNETTSEIIHYLTVRYGDFILLKPRMTPQTLLLWCAPFICFILGIFIFIQLIRRRQQAL